MHHLPDLFPSVHCSVARWLWLTPDFLWLDGNNLIPLCPSVCGLLRGYGHLSLPLRMPLFLSQNPRAAYLQKHPRVGSGVGEGKGLGAERGNQGLNQGEKLLQSCGQPVVNPCSSVWHLHGDGEGTRRETCPARLGSQIKRCFLAPLLQTTRLPPSGSRNWETNSRQRLVLGRGGGLWCLIAFLSGSPGIGSRLCSCPRLEGGKSEGTSPGQNSVGVSLGHGEPGVSTQYLLLQALGHLQSEGFPEEGTEELDAEELH